MPEYRVVWSTEDDGWVATVTGWPSFSWIAETPERALEGLLEQVRGEWE